MQQSQDESQTRGLEAFAFTGPASLPELEPVLSRRLYALAHSIKSLHAAVSEDPDPAFELASLGIGVRMGELLFESAYILNALGFQEEAVLVEKIRQRLHREVFKETDGKQEAILSELSAELEVLSSRFPVKEEG